MSKSRAVCNLVRLEDVGEGQPVYTTGAVGKVLRAAPKTVLDWIDSGKLEGFRLPPATRRGATRRTAGDRRVTHAALLAFCRRFGIPAHLTGLASPVVLVMTHDAALLDHLADFLPRAGLAVERPPTWYAFGRRVSDVLPTAVVLDPAAGRRESLEAAAEWPAVSVVLGVEDWPCPEVPAGCAVLPWPWVPTDVAGACVRRCAGHYGAGRRV